MDLALRAYSIPLRTRFRGLEVRTGLLLESPSGWGEFSPFADYPDRLSARWLGCAKEAAGNHWPRPRRHRIPVNVTIPAVAPADAHAMVVASGCSTAKVKVGDASDEARVEAVRDALGANGKLRIDVNAGWDVETAVGRLTELSHYDLEYAEQPVATLEEMAELRRRVDVPLAVDESLRLAVDPLEVDVEHAADVAVLKVAPLGGVAAALRVAEAVGVPSVVSSALETSVGLAAGIALAAALPELPYACGLGTATLLEGDVVSDPLAPQDGYIVVRRADPDDRLLTQWELTEGPDLARLHRQLAAAEAVLQ
ncbi:MAG: o-succinylbenzoate synthase [Actinomycetota bacterium]